MNTLLLIVDPQNDFCDPAGSLYVPGAEHDMARLATLLEQAGHLLDRVQVTLDTHTRWDIAHPLWWRDAQGETPAPFTQIHPEDVERGRFTTRRPEDAERSLRYLRELQLRERFSHTIWPEHCLRGDWGHNVLPMLSQALHAWERRRQRNVQMMRKGENAFTEHFSAVRAEVPDRWDPSTQPNDAFVGHVEQADLVLLGGEAASHCMLHTVLDLSSAFADPKSLNKLVWLRDATSAVPDPEGTTLFSAPLEAKLAELCRAGMRIATTTEMCQELQEAA